ncbi:actin-depolymerizing factor [Cymbomonas tetramitiformis]|uniref:Actin-depolymerizing factor n=1 Tax=Cymbomonas tetramitiformis TaxID=36881 RepID=A0AAE0LHP3_9CHLO|nr:actin-depolymerizing factor [Cymbomonas tetramitiformis]
MAGAASGVAVGDKCVETFLELKKARTHQYVVYKIDMAAGEVVIDKVGDKGAAYDEFTAYLLSEAPQDCRYAVYDYSFTDGEGCQKSKIVFIAWYEINNLFDQF